MHEASLYPENSFLTLTYDDEHLPKNNTLRYSDVQQFLKRLRKTISPTPIRYYLCGEYGDINNRPHYHICLFNKQFNDKTIDKKTEAGSYIYTSTLLTKLWPLGLIHQGDLTLQSAQYTARYVLKKQTGQQAEKHYEVIDPESGEITSRVPEFCKMSLKPGIGAGWLKKYNSDVWTHDYVIANGRETQPPRYYDKIWKRTHPEQFEDAKIARQLRGMEKAYDNTQKRLEVKETVQIAKMAALRRNL